MSTNHVGHIPDYIEARSVKALRALMFSTNIEAGYQFRYFDIQHYKTKNGQTRWVAWFYRDIADTLKKEIANGDEE